MQETIEVYYYDETYIQIIAEEGILREISAYFTFEIPNAKFHPKVKARIWDGKVKLFNKINQTLYAGLLDELKKFSADRKYFLKFCEFPDEIYNSNQELTIDEFVQKLNLGVKPHDFQLEALSHAISKKRAVFLSPTSSGKSLIIYMLIRYFLKGLRENRKVLLIVPTVALIFQMIKEFKEYSPDFPIEKLIHTIYEGQSKDSNKPIFVSTWQSIYDMPKEYMHQFDCVIGDECHLLKASSIKRIFENAINAYARFGLTGTLDNKECHVSVIMGLTGAIHEVVEVKELIDRGIVSKPKINCVVLKYPDSDRKIAQGFDYHEEVEFIEEHDGREKVISQILKGIKGNCLVIANKIDHIERLKKIADNTGKKVYVIAGSGKYKTEYEEREAIRQIFEGIDNAILIATAGTCSTGVSVKNIQHVMFASSSKSEIKVVQIIGRGLRLDGKSNKVTIWDIVDDFSKLGPNGKISKVNTLVKHFFERIRIYESVGYEYKISNINILNYFGE